MHRLHLIISGRVQGVCFRAETRAVARRLGLTGWVKNLPSGSVEAMAEGPKELLFQFLSWCQKGPYLARVDEVQSDWQQPTGEFEGYSIR